MSSPSPFSALDEAEFEALCDTLDAHSELDYDAFLGFAHAIAVAPSQVPPSLWISALFPNGFDGLDERQVTAAMALIMRQFNEVVGALADGDSIIPEPDEERECAAFAVGYTMAATLDTEWIGDDARWSFVAPFAFLAGEYDLISKPLLQKMRADPDIEQTLRNHMAALLYSTNESFEAVRLAQLGVSAPAPASSPKVGRNEACPCGSGRKYKRCCGAAGIASAD